MAVPQKCVVCGGELVMGTYGRVCMKTSCEACQIPVCSVCDRPKNQHVLGCKGPDNRDPVTSTEDPWRHRSKLMRCQTCMFYVAKVVEKTELQGKQYDVVSELGRCRRHAPTLGGWPAVFGATDWCGDHKLNESEVG